MKKILSYELLTHKGSHFELEDAVVKGVPCKVFPRGPQTLWDVFMKAAAFADSEFIVKDDERLTFSQAFWRGHGFARHLRQKYGIKKGSRIAIIMETGPEWAVSFMAFCFAGAVPVVIPTDMEERAALDVLELTNCELVVADFSSAGKINLPGMNRPVVIPATRPPDAIPCGDYGSAPDFSIFNLADAPEGKNAAGVDETCQAAPDDEAMISFTSGTTGRPKGVVLSHRNMTTGLMNMMLGGFFMSLRAAQDGRKQPPYTQPCSLLLSPFSHIGGYSQLMLMCYLSGKIVSMPEWDTGRAATLIENERIRSLCGLSPAMAADLLRVNRSTNRLESLAYLNIYGVALHKKFISEFAEEFSHINLGTGYGMTETCGAVSAASGTDLLDNPEFSGLALPSVNIKIVDSGGREAAQGDRGEIWVRGAMVMRGYYSGRGNPGIALEDGWLKTGDMGYIDHAGSLCVAGRRDVLQCGKKQILSGELERLICELNTVDEAVALKTRRSGQDASVVVVVVPNSAIQTNADELTREVSDCVKNHADNMDNIKVVIMNDIPRTASGKTDRRALKQRLME